MSPVAVVAEQLVWTSLHSRTGATPTATTSLYRYRRCRTDRGSSSRQLPHRGCRSHGWTSAPTRAPVMRALAESERAYADSARTLSSPERLPEPDVNRLARAALNTLKAPNLALLLLRHDVELHPTSARAMARLADGYLVAGDTASAVARLRRAIDMSPKSPTELPTDARAKLATLWRCCSTISGRTTRLRGRRT